MVVKPHVVGKREYEPSWETWPSKIMVDLLKGVSSLNINVVGGQVPIKVWANYIMLTLLRPISCLRLVRARPP